MAMESDKVMFEIYRDGTYTGKYRVVYYTELNENNKEWEINKAMAGEHFYDGFIRNFRKDEAKDIIESVLKRLNDGEKLTPDELVLLAGVVALPSSDPSVREFLSRPHRVDGSARVENCVFNGMLIQRAWIFIADPDSRSQFQPPPYVVTQPMSAKARIVKPGISRSAARRGGRKRRSRG